LTQVIKTRALKKRYAGAKANAVDAVDIDVEGGTIYGLLGPNGAGKTTTLSLLSGLLTPDSGTVEIRGAPVKRDVRRVLGYVPQDLAIFSRLTGLENLQFFGRLYHLRGRRLRRRIDEVLQMVGLEERAGDLVARYSAGMTRRLNLAAGLVHEPEIILLDEPTVGIDPQSRNCIMEAVRRLKEGGATVLYTTHYMEEAAKLCDRIGIMDRGRILIDDDPVHAVKEQGLARIELAVSERAEELAAGLREMTSVRKVVVEQGDLVLQVAGDAPKLAIIERAQKRAGELGVELRLRKVREPDLESLFLDITGRRLRDGGEAY
jgi:ABC-2 type transport system ATP-binding protein